MPAGTRQAVLARALRVPEGGGRRGGAAGGEGKARQAWRRVIDDILFTSDHIHLITSVYGQPLNRHRLHMRVTAA